MGDGIRIFTFIGLVLRRLWAKRGLLVGSFLGAALVTALLAIVPLYEASISAVDLGFTFRQATSSQVDITAARVTNPYSPGAADTARAAVAAEQSSVAQWYPELLEKTLSRELFFIPLGPPQDWLAQAALWRNEATAWAERAIDATSGRILELAPNATTTQELVTAIAVAGVPRGLTDDAGEPLERFPDPPYPTPPQEATVTRILTAPDIESRLEIVAGEWPASEGDTLRLALGEDLARLRNLEPGGTEILKPFVSSQQAFELIEVGAVVRPLDPTDPFWQGLNPSTLTFLPQEDFDRWTGAVPSDASDDPWLRDTAGFQRLNAVQSWQFPMDRDSIELADLNRFSVTITNFQADLARNGVTARSSAPALVEAFDLRAVVFGGPVLAMLALVVAGALYFLIYTAGLTIEREGPELALLRTRGASAWQTTGLHLAQSAFIAVAAGIVAPWLARILVATTGRIPPMSELTGGGALEVVQDRPVLPFVIGGAVLAFVSMGLAILPFARRSVLELRLLAARPSHTSVWQRYYLDVFFVVIAAILLFELRERGLVDVDTNPGLDPFAVASPALFLFAGALVLLRVLPYLLRGLGWAMTRLRGMAAALPGWHMGRNPVPYGRLALLIFLTTGFGAFALTYAQTLERSYDDRSGFAAGAEARLVGDGVGLLPLPDGVSGSAVYRTVGAPRQASTRGSEVLAVRPRDFASVVYWREDFGGTPTEVFGALGDGSPVGIELPMGTTAITAFGVPAPGTWLSRSRAEETGRAIDSSYHLMLRLNDGLGRLWTFASPTFDNGGWTEVSVFLGPSAARNEPFVGGLVEPLQLQAVWIEREPISTEPARLAADTVYLTEITAVSDTGNVVLDELISTEFEAVGGIESNSAPGDQPAEDYYREIPEGESRPASLADSPFAREGTVTAWNFPTRSYNQAVPYFARPLDPIPVLVDSEAAAIGGLSVGATATFGIDGLQLPGVVIGTVEQVPTATDARNQGLIVTDLDILMSWLNHAPRWSLESAVGPQFAPGEIWLSASDPEGSAAQIAGQTEEETVIITAAGTEAAFSSRPVQIGLVSILFVGAAAGVVLALAGVIGYVLIAVQRRTREMGVLRAIGFRQRSVAATFAVEQLVVLGVGTVIGVAGGLGLMRLVLPFLQLGEGAEELVPPVLMVLDTRVLGLYLALVTALLVVSVIGATRRVSARDLAEVLREVEG